MTYGEEFSAIVRAIAAALAEKDNVALKPLEQQLLHVFLQHPTSTYSQIRDIIHRDHRREVTVGHLRNTAVDLWEKLGSFLGTKIEKHNVVAELQTWHGREQLPEVFGRDELIETLTTRYLLNSYYRVVCVTGMPRIGKSELVTAALSLLIRQGGTSNRPLWYEAHEVKTVAELLGKVANRINISTQNTDNVEHSVDALVDLLHRHPRLIAIDNADVLYDPSLMSGEFQARNGYESFLKRVVRDPTLQGQVLWVSRVMPSCLDEASSMLHRFEVPPLATEDALSLCKKNSLETDNPIFFDLLNFCAGHPGLLKIAATKIPDSSESNIQSFLSDPFKGTIPEDEYWFKLIAELSMPERQLAIWLMLSPLSYQTINSLNIRGPSGLHSTDAFRSLERRGLVKSDDQGFCQLHPPYVRYALANWLVRNLSEQLLALEIADLRHYPLTLPTALVVHRKWHQKYIFAPFLAAITERHWHQNSRQQWLSELIRRMPKTSDNRDGRPEVGCFGFGNLLSLAAAFQTPLNDLDLTGCIIRCADLQNADLRNVCMANCLLEQTELPIFLEDPIKVDLAADGKAIAIGDAAGRVCYWINTEGVFVLERYHRFRTLDNESNAIQAISLDDETLLISVGQQIYRWWLRDDEQPERKISVNGTVKALRQHQDFIAIGLNDGAVGIFDRVFNTLYEYQTSSGSVHCLAFSDTGETLISIGLGNRLLCWDLLESPPALRDGIPSQGRVLQSASWYEGRILQAATIYKDDYSCPSIDSGTGTWRDVNELRGVTQLSFSRNGHYLVGCNAEGKIYRWQYPFADHRLVASLDDRPQKLVVSNDGQSLLAVYANERLSAETIVQLWNINNNQLIWEFHTSCPPPHGIQLENATGISDATMQHLAEFSRNP